MIAGDVWSFRADPRTTRIALGGDSTMTEKSGWGNGFKALVSDDAAFLNASRGGRSSKSFAAEGHWKELLRHKPTHILIQFGHNDEPGKGLDRESDLPAFRANMGRYVDEARAAGAVPILVTPLTRRIPSRLGDYAEQTRAVAAEKNAPLIDLYARSVEVLDRLGSAAAVAISPLKPDGTIDKTHLNAEGSALFGSVVAEELRRVMPEMARFVRAPKPITAPIAPWSVRMADSVMKRNPDPLLLDVTGDKPKWDYTQGLILLAVQQVAQKTGDRRYSDYVKAYYDKMIASDGTIQVYKLDEYSLDRINAGKELFDLYASTHDEKYRKAIETLRQQLREHPRNADGGFWHKKRYPHQMWLDGLYMINDKTVVRGGVGLFSYDYYFDAGNQTGFAQPTPILTTNDNGKTFLTDMNYSPLVYALDCEDIAITGEGTLDGQADEEHWWNWKPSKGTQAQTSDRNALFKQNEDQVPVGQRVYGPGHYLRPSFVEPYRCRNILIEGVTIRNAPMWVLHPTLSSNITIRRVTVIGHDRCRR